MGNCQDAHGPWNKAKISRRWRWSFLLQMAGIAAGLAPQPRKYPSSHGRNPPATLKANRQEYRVERMFTHRFNADGTVDSICHGCFMTVATARREGDLHAVEQNHACDPNQERLDPHTHKFDPELINRRP